MFWDGEKWVSEARPAPAPGPIRHRRVRDWFATLPIVLLVPALMLPLVVTQAAPPSGNNATASPVALDVEPVISLDGQMAPGTTFRVKGASFAPMSNAAILWDTNKVLAKLSIKRTGSFTIRASVPAGADPGKHTVAVVYMPNSGDPAATTDVVVPDVAPTPDPTATPTQKPDPTPDPTATPTPSPPRRQRQPRPLPPPPRRPWLRPPRRRLPRRRPRPWLRPPRRRSPRRRPDRGPDGDADRGTDRHADRDPDRGPDRHADGCPDGDPDRGSDRHADGCPDGDPDRGSDRHADGCPDGDPDRGSDRHAGTDRGAALDH